MAQRDANDGVGRIPADRDIGPVIVYLDGSSPASGPYMVGGEWFHTDKNGRCRAGLPEEGPADNHEPSN